ncbi:MAG: energy transducer TonB [Bacteroides stercoris]
MDKILKNSIGKISFEEWLKRKNIDPNNLEETMEHYMEDEVSEVNDGTDATGVMGKHYTVALQGDSLLLYMPDEKKRKIAEITAFAPSEGKASRLLINHERCSELIEWLCSEKSPDNTKQTEPEEMEEVDYFSPDLQPAKPINPQTGMPDDWNMVLERLLRKPEEAVEQGITGSMTAEITIGTDGVASNVKIDGDPHPLLKKAVCDCLYGIKYVPAKWNGKAIPFVFTLPVFLTDRAYGRIYPDCTTDSDNRTDYLEKEAGLQRAVRLSGSGCYFHDCICSDHRSVQSGASYHQ